MFSLSIIRFYAGATVFVQLYVIWLVFYFYFILCNLPDELTAAIAGNCCTWFHCLKTLLVLYFVLQPQLLLQIITRFASAYCSTIEGTAKNIETTEL